MATYGNNTWTSSNVSNNAGATASLVKGRGTAEGGGGIPPQYTPSYGGVSYKPKQPKSSFEQWNIEKTQPKLSYPAGMFGYGNTMSDTAFAQRGRRGTRSRQQQEEYKRQAAENSYNIRRETALKNDGYFKELTDGSNISSDRRAFLENELDLYARDDKDWYWGRGIRESQKRERDEFNRLSELVKTPQWKMMTPEQQEAERAKLRGARDEAVRAGKEKITFDFEREWEQNKGKYVEKAKTVPDTDFSTFYGNKYRNLSEEDKAKANFIYDYHNKLGKGGALRAISELDKFIQEKADERTVAKSNAEAFRLKQAWEAKDMQGNVLPNAVEIRQGFIEKGRNAEWHPLNASDSPLERAAGSTEQHNLDKYNSLSNEEQMYIDFLAGYYNEVDFKREYNAFLQGKRNEEFRKLAENNEFVRNMVAPAKYIGNSLLGSGAMILDTAAQSTQNYFSGYNDLVNEHSPGMIMLDTAESDKQAWLGDSTGWVRKAKEFGLGMVDTMVPMATGPVAAPFIYAAKSAGRSAYETTKKGGSADKALKMGALNGAVTYLVAKGPVEHLFNGMASATERVAAKQTFGQAFRKYLAVQGLSEGAEGLIENYSNTLFDVIINRDNSDIIRSVDALMAQGYSKDEAMKKAAIVHLAIDPLVSGAMEALGGLVMAGGKVGVDFVGSLRSEADVSYESGGIVANEKTTARDIIEQFSRLGLQVDEEYANGVLEHIRSETQKIPETTIEMLRAYSKRGRVKAIIGDTVNLTGQESAGGFTRKGNALMLDWKTAQDSNAVARAIINHEAVHATETSRFYEELKDYAFSHMFKSEAEKNAAIDKKIQRYAKSGVTLDKPGAEAELVARYIGENLLTRPEAVDLFVKQNGGLAKQMYDSLVDTYNRVKTYFADRESYEARYALSDIEKGIKLFEKAFGTRRTALDEVSEKYGWSGNNASGDVQYRIMESKENGKVAFLDGKRIGKRNDETRSQAIRRFFNEKFKNKPVTVNETMDKVGMDQIGKYIYPGTRGVNYNKKISVLPILDDLIQIGSAKRWSENLLDKSGNVKKHAGYDCSNVFNYYDTKFAIDNSGIIYGGTIIVRLDKNGNAYFYDLDNVREVGYQDENEFYPAISLSTSLTNNSILQSGANVNDFEFASPAPAKTEYERSIALDESLEEYAKRLKAKRFPDEEIERILNQINYGMRYALEGDYSVIQEILPGVSLKAVEKSALTGDISYIFPKPNGGENIGNIADIGKNTVKNHKDSLNVTIKSDIISEKQFVDNPFDENKQLKPNVRYKSGEYDYKGETDDLGRVCKVQFSDLKKTTRTKRLRYNNKTPGKLKGDHAGHILGVRFGGSSQFDNLVSQASNVNLSEYKKIENIWDRAISAGKTVSGNVNIMYDGSNVRPIAFDVHWTIDNVCYSARIVN